MRILMRRGGRVARGLTVVVVLCGMGSAALGQAAATQPAPADSVAVPPELQAAVQADLARAEAAVPRSNADVAALAKEEMAAANAVSKLGTATVGDFAGVAGGERQAGGGEQIPRRDSREPGRGAVAAGPGCRGAIQQQAAATLQAMATRGRKRRRWRGRWKRRGWPLSNDSPMHTGPTRPMIRIRQRR